MNDKPMMTVGIEGNTVFLLHGDSGGELQRYRIDLPLSQAHALARYISVLVEAEVQRAVDEALERRNLASVVMATQSMDAFGAMFKSIQAADKYDQHKAECDRCGHGSNCQCGWNLKSRAQVARGDALALMREEANDAES